MGKKDKFADKKKAAEAAKAPTIVQGSENLNIAGLPISTQPSQQSAPFHDDLKPLKAANVKDAEKFQGKAGIPCKLEANMLTLDIKKLTANIYHYDVSIAPYRPKKFLPEVLKQFFAKNFKNVFYAFDSFANVQAQADVEVVRSNVYINKKLNIVEEFSDQITIDGKKFNVKIKLAAIVDMKQGLDRNIADQQAVQCLDIVIRSVFRDVLDRGQGFSSGSRIFFPGSAFDINNRNRDFGKVKIIPGIFQSAQICRAGMFLNLDITHKAFSVEVPVTEFIAICLNARDIPHQIDPRDEKVLERELFGKTLNCKIVGTNRIKSQKFVRFAKSDTKFELNMEGQPKRMITVIDYYQKVKNYKVKYPKLPLLQFGPKDKPLYFLMELCSTIRQPVQTDIVSETATACPERKKRIINYGSNLKYSDSKVIENFGITMATNFISDFAKVQGRILVGPKLEYKNGLINVNEGVWNGGTFLTTGAMASNLKWAIISTNNSRQVDLITLAKTIEQKAAEQEIYLVKPGRSTDMVFTINIDDIAQKLRTLKSEGYGLVFVILDDRNKDNYGKVKRAAELESSKIDIMTQCLKGSTFNRMLRDQRSLNQIVENLLKKDNGKLNGTNYAIDDQASKRHHGTMFVGADVNHPGSTSKPSVVGISASDDLIGMRYNCIYQYQASRQEWIGGFDRHIKVFLARYKKVNGKYPERIIYYRDGVSEGQFSIVMEAEWAEIKKGLREVFGTAPMPKMSFVCVQKRHHVRLFPTDGKTSGKGNNIKPGTIVDTEIVHPTYYQFYLASHAAIQGTTRPAKYCVLKDEINMSVDDLQRITHDLCHAFIRCTRAVSYPAPTYYSHCIAKRVEAYLPQDFFITPDTNLHELNDRFKVSQSFINNTQMFFV